MKRAKSKAKAKAKSKTKRAGGRTPTKRAGNAPPPPPPPEPRAQSLRRHGALVDAMERARDLMANQVPGVVTLTMRPPPTGVASQAFRTDNRGRPLPGFWRSPWALVAKFTFRTPVTYRDIYRGIRAWERSAPLNREIGPFRASRIMCDYGEVRGTTEQFVLSDTAGPWEASITSALDMMDPNDEDGLSATYDPAGGRTGDIQSITVWLADGEYSEWTP